MKHKQEVAFINREKELNFLADYIAKRPSEILFLHGPKSSGKTTVLYRFFEQFIRGEKLEVKFLNLREILIVNYKDFLQIFFNVDYEKSKEDVKEIREYDLKVFKAKIEVLKGMKEGRINPFSVMKKELIKLNDKNIKPVIVIDELQALGNIYMNGQRELINELFNFFVAMTKESHLSHIIISSSDGYFIDTIYNDSKLKKTSRFYKLDYLPEKDVREWLFNLDKYSKITNFELTEEGIQKIWDVVGGSAWEIQCVLSELFSKDIDTVLTEYKKQMRGIIVDYVVDDNRPIKEKILKRFQPFGTRISKEYFESKEIDCLKNMVANNILYYDPVEAIFYPQGKSMEWGIQLFFNKQGG